MIEDTLFFIVKTFLQKEQYHLNLAELKLQLLSHPSHPSLHAITGVLDHFGIDNLALEVPRNQEILVQLPRFFIAHINDIEDGPAFVVVTKKQEQLELIFENKQKKLVHPEDFFKIWDGIIVVIDKEEVPTKSTKTRFPSLSYPMMAGIISLVILSFLFYTQPPFALSIYFLLAILGIVGSVLIIRHDLGLYSETVNKFCTVSQKSSCDVVLDSKGATLFGWLKLSDLSFTYFVGLTLACFLSFITPSHNQAIFLMLSGLSMPIVAYAIYYQWRILKKWCPLCLSIATVLVVQSIIMLFGVGNASAFNINITAIPLLLFSFFSVFIAWMWLKPILEQNKKLKTLEIEHYKFKRNFTFFNSVYQLSPLLDTRIKSTQEVTFGAKNAPLDVVVVTNPTCYFCKETHTLVEDILKKYAENVRITIRFYVHIDDTTNQAYQIASRVLQLYHSKNPADCQAALHEVYSDDVNRDKWLEKWTCENDTSYHHVLVEEKDWCLQNNIHFTPAILVNGRSFPDVYQRTDLKYFIEDLVEQTQEENSSLSI